MTKWGGGEGRKVQGGVTEGTARGHREHGVERRWEERGDFEGAEWGGTPEEPVGDRLYLRYFGLALEVI